ncbi:MAG: septum formation protein Maf [Verrucomicrobia bacterium]|nr:MAG: septum formation protein Maf [Verrucomicrobiota bacterium]
MSLGHRFLGELHKGRCCGQECPRSIPGLTSARRLSCHVPTDLKSLPPLILASTSPRREELLRKLGFEFRIAPSSAPEIHPEGLTAAEVSRINAYRKARAVAKKHPDALVLGADTLVTLDGALFGKPASLEEAFAMLERLQGRTHEVVTGICLLHLREHRQRVSCETTTVTFRKLDEAGIQRYLLKVNPLDKAGAYGIQEERELIIERIAGSYSNVVGLPMERLAAELRVWERVSV